MSKAQTKKHMEIDNDLAPEEIKTIKRIESGNGRFSKTYASPRELVEDLHKETKTKMNSPPLSDEEIADIKKARKSKGKIYETPEKLIRDLHANVANQKKASV
ncbi:MAG: hypothetical protein ACREAR_07920 [Nitrosotalea sp.]